MGWDEKAVSADTEVDVEALVIGVGVVGIYQLYRLQEAGFSVKALEAGDGVGGTWYWNRYPACRFDSESYTYGYLFSKELFEEWEWAEHFATQPEIESYLNHVVDRFDLRQHIRFGSKVVSAVYDEGTATWTVSTADGFQTTTRFLISATGGLSVPNIPDLPGRENFRGEAHHTGAWPHTPVDFRGKRVAILGNGPSGAQLLPEIADQVASVTMYQRTPTWSTPLNNGPITDEQRAWLRENFQQIRETLSTSPTGFLHQSDYRRACDDTKAERWEFYERIWNSPGFAKLTTNYIDMTTDAAVNAEFCEFLAQKIRSIVKDPATADKLIPKDHGFGAKRPPFVTGYYEAYNEPTVELVDLKATSIVRITATGIETTDQMREHDIIVWATGFDFGTGALTRMGVRGRDGLDLGEDWAEGPSTYLGFSAHKLPNFFFPGGPHGAGGGNYPRYSADQVDFITETLTYMRAKGYDVFEPSAEHQDEWMTMIETLAPRSMFSEAHSHYYGANVEGKPKKFLLNPGGRPKLHELMAAAVDSDYEGLLASTTEAESFSGDISDDAEREVV